MTQKREEGDLKGGGMPGRPGSGMRCGEFMPAEEKGTPLALKCATCECHRNFHRRESEVGSSTGATPPPPPLPQSSSTTPNNCYISFGKNNTTAMKPTIIRSQPRAPLMMTFGGDGAAAESSSKGQTAMAAQFAEQYGVSKKRFRSQMLTRLIIKSKHTPSASMSSRHRVKLNLTRLRTIQTNMG